MSLLIKKEMRLAAHILSYLFILFAFMTMLPGYPILVGSFFVCLGLFYTFQNGRENNDVLYTALLPVKKAEVVSARFCFVLIIEMSAFALSAALTLLRMMLLSDAQVYLTNPLLNANLVYLAFQLLIFGAFNCVFLPKYYKTAYKIGLPFVCFCTVSFIIIGVAETLHHIPGLEWISDTGFASWPEQCSLLGAAILLFAAVTGISVKVSQKRFCMLDL